MEDDIRRLHDMIAAAEKHHEAMYERYRELPGWRRLLHARISMALGQPEIVLGVMLREGQE